MVLIVFTELIEHTLKCFTTFANIIDKKMSKGAEQKYYVVWQGKESGIYTTWEECKKMVIGVAGAKYKSYKTLAEAEKAYKEEPPVYSRKAKEKKVISQNMPKKGWAVDAACSHNPGPVEYRGVDIESGDVIFSYSDLYGTNNQGEFLAIVHALALQVKKGINMPIYSDSRTARAWVRNGKAKSMLEVSDKTQEMLLMIERAEKWLAQNTQHGREVLKWDTDEWGEIPADYGRK